MKHDWHPAKREILCKRKSLQILINRKRVMGCWPERWHEEIRARAQPNASQKTDSNEDKIN
ncbi:MAG: hypothetical protein D3922_02445 [Candidatus Electrothrix sp. AR1]|nr:hypothetical protein [Candidatus Electrothrix sp. AR1]